MWTRACINRVSLGNGITSKDPVLDFFVCQVNVGRVLAICTPAHRLAQCPLRWAESFKDHFIHTASRNLGNDGDSLIFGHHQRSRRRTKDFDLDAGNSGNVRAGVQGSDCQLSQARISCDQQSSYHTYKNQCGHQPLSDQTNRQQSVHLNARHLLSDFALKEAAENRRVMQCIRIVRR